MGVTRVHAISFGPQKTNELIKYYCMGRCKLVCGHGIRVLLLLLYMTLSLDTSVFVEI